MIQDKINAEFVDLDFLEQWANDTLDEAERVKLMHSHCARFQVIIEPFDYTLLRHLLQALHKPLREQTRLFTDTINDENDRKTALSRLPTAYIVEGKHLIIDYAALRVLDVNGFAYDLMPIASYLEITY